MWLAYYDESGDDGYPRFSSPLFTLSALYMHYTDWKANYEAIRDMRRRMKEQFGLPMKLEIHTKYLLLNKAPYKTLDLSDAERIAIVDACCELLASLRAQAINLCIVKPRIKSPTYKVLDTAVTYSVQRIENDLKPWDNPENQFMIITDSGRVGKMRKTTRRVQVFNPIPSKLAGSSYRREIQALIEDPLPKDSKESYYVQLSDVLAYIVYLYALLQTGVAAFPNRMPADVDQAKVTAWMDTLKPCLNLRASEKEPYGVVFHPQ
ncbi:MAG: DUF3800 domain-containing protein [Candidatus Bipolaricaulota bacterium]|nr:DUF3800 domain-containing protein [Candidatus Bipolaricaulota bacterium]